MCPAQGGALGAHPSPPGACPWANFTVCITVPYHRCEAQQITTLRVVLGTPTQCLVRDLRSSARGLETPHQESLQCWTSGQGLCQNTGEAWAPPGLDPGPGWGGPGPSQKEIPEDDKGKLGATVAKPVSRPAEGSLHRFTCMLNSPMQRRADQGNLHHLS